MSQDARPDRRVYRSRSGMVALVIAGAITLFLLGDAALRSGVGGMLLLAPGILLVDWIIFAVLFVPKVQTDAHGVTVINPLRCAEVPWGRVRDITTRWQLTLHLDDGSQIAAFGGPEVRRPRPRPRATPWSDAERPGATSSDLDLILGEWENADSRLSSAGEVRRWWNLPVLLSLAGLIVWGLLAVMVSGMAA